MSLQLLNGCQQKPKSISGEEFYEIEERLKDALSNVSVLEAERDDLAQSKFDLESRVGFVQRTAFILVFVYVFVFVCVCVCVYVFVCLFVVCMHKRVA